MRTLELRLEDVGYHFEDGAWRSMPLHADAAGERVLGLSREDASRMSAALEFFDRAYLQVLGGIACRPDKDFRIGETLTVERESVAFALARNTTLLRFGVRIVGLEEQEEEDGESHPEVHFGYQERP